MQVDYKIFSFASSFLFCNKEHLNVNVQRGPSLSNGLNSAMELGRFLGDPLEVFLHTCLNLIQKNTVVFPLIIQPS